MENWCKHLCRLRANYVTDVTPTWLYSFPAIFTTVFTLSLENVCTFSETNKLSYYTYGKRNDGLPYFFQQSTVVKLWIQLDAWAANAGTRIQVSCECLEAELTLVVRSHISSVTLTDLWYRIYFYRSVNGWVEVSLYVNLLPIHQRHTSAQQRPLAEPLHHQPP